MSIPLTPGKWDPPFVEPTYVRYVPGLPTDDELTLVLLAMGFTSCLGVPYKLRRVEQMEEAA